MPTMPPSNGVAYAAAAKGAIDDETRSTLFAAIVRSIHWMEAITSGAEPDFHGIARREGLAERHVRLFAPVAYLFPRFIETIVEGRAPKDLTVTQLARGLPLLWCAQQHRINQNV